MGTVYRGEDLADGSLVAIKVLKPALAGSSRRRSCRFHKEARMLAEVNNPRVANFIELNEDDGVHYLALEYVAGTNLADWMVGRGPIDERAEPGDPGRRGAGRSSRPTSGGSSIATSSPRTSWSIDDPAEALGADPARLPGVKLSDFGLARHVVESESLES